MPVFELDEKRIAFPDPTLAEPEGLQPKLSHIQITMLSLSP